MMIQRAGYTQPTLDAKELALVELVVDPTDSRTAGQKGIAAGYQTTQEAYKVLRRPHVAAELRRLTDEHMATQRSRLARILSALGDMAEKGDLKAAELFAEYVGHLSRGGMTVVNNLSQTNTDESLADRLARNHAERFTGVSSDS